MTNSTSQEIRATTKLSFIQAFRGIAALLVVLYHGSRFISPYGTGLGEWFFGPAGSLGVVLFFVVSGFIMVHTTVRSDHSVQAVSQFLIKRFSRVWPVYAVATLTFVFLRLDGVTFFHDTNRLVSLLLSLIFIPSGNGPPPVFGFPVLVVGWSLNYEMYFYTIFGLSIFFGRWRWVALGLWLTATLLVLPLMAGHTTLSTTLSYGYNSPYLQLITSPIIWQFAAGVVIGLVYQSKISLHSSVNVGLLIFFVSAFVVWQYTSRFHTDHGILDWGLSVIPLMLVFSLASKNMSFGAPVALVYLGDISYSLYLWHPAVQEALSGPFVSFGRGDLTMGFSYLFLTTVITIAVAAASHQLLEIWLSAKVKSGLLNLLSSVIRR